MAWILWRKLAIRETHKVNHRIKVPELRVITREGDNLGVLKTQEALRIAEERELDLVLISETASPPVAKILDFNKFLYEERKRTSAAKAKSKKSEVKEFRLSPTIGDGDFMIRVNRAKEFLKDGNRVKVTLKLIGRKAAFPQLGFEKIRRFTQEIAEEGKSESEPRLMGNIISVTYVAK